MLELKLLITQSPSWIQLLMNIEGSLRSISFGRIILYIFLKKKYSHVREFFFDLILTMLPTSSVHDHDIGINIGQLQKTILTICFRCNLIYQDEISLL